MTVFISRKEALTKIKDLGRLIVIGGTMEELISNKDINNYLALLFSEGHLKEDYFVEDEEDDEDEDELEDMPGDEDDDDRDEDWDDEEDEEILDYTYPDQFDREEVISILVSDSLLPKAIALMLDDEHLNNILNVRNKALK